MWCMCRGHGLCAMCVVVTDAACRIIVVVTTGPLTYWGSQLDRVVARMGKGDGAAEGLREA
jgi:hypothetical protein